MNLCQIQLRRIRWRDRETQGCRIHSKSSKLNKTEKNPRCTQYVCCGVRRWKQIKPRPRWRTQLNMDLLGRGTGLSAGREDTALHPCRWAITSPLLMLPPASARGRRGRLAATEPSSSTLMCPWSFVKAGYLLLQSNGCSLGAAAWRTRRYEKSAVFCYEALSTFEGVAC